ncbi:MAG: adenylate/guanylate cyclase domain-containing protein, partial [Geminicoccaceae bacterium]
MTLPAQAVERLVAGALEGRSDDLLFGALCDDLLEGGIPLLRGAVGSQFLHPTLDVRLLRWVRGQGTEGQTFEREPDGAPVDEEWVSSPLYRLTQRQEFLLHRRIDAASIAEFPLLGEFAALGGKDYVALRQPIGRGAMFGEVNEVYASWITDRESGFTPDEVAVFERLQPHLVLALVAVGNVWIARALLETYLGRDAAGRVLAGNIIRGRTDTIRAVIWYSDLRGFTRLTDTLPRSEILVLLNEYVEPLVEAVMAEGGEVLKFMGDGVLAIFGGRPPTEACAAALRAWERAGA